MKVVDTKFKPGTSGNPAGRPKGSKNQITLLKQSLELALREDLQHDMPAVLQKAMELALGGNTTMIKLLVELHMSKSSNDDTAKGGERVAIQINSQAPQVVEVIDLKPETQPEED